MDYIGNVIRPPSEADSIILQVTVGCSYNKCTFCGAYKEVHFSIKARETILEDLKYASQYCKNIQRLFLADGDVLSLSMKRLRDLLGLIKLHLPWVSHVSCYSTARALSHKSERELDELKSLGIKRVYMGLESGSDHVLEMINKGTTAAQMIAAAEKLRKVKIFSSVTVLLGAGGVSHSQLHAVKSGEVLQQMAPNQIAALTLMILENTPLGHLVESGEFQLPSPDNILRELRTILLNLGETRCQFHSNHASSYLMLAGRLPKDKAKMLYYIDEALRGTISKTPEILRRL